MDTITTIGAAECRTLRPIITEALERALAGSGLDVDLGRMGYDGQGMVRFTVTLNVTGAKANREEAEYRQWQSIYADSPLAIPDYGTVVRHAGQEWRVTGYRPRASRNPIVLTNDHDARRLNASAQWVLRHATSAAA